MAEEHSQDSHSILASLPGAVADEFKTHEFLRFAKDDKTLINLVKDGESHLRDQATQKGVDLSALQVLIDTVKEAAPERFRVDDVVDLSRVRGLSPLSRSLSEIQDQISLQSAQLSGIHSTIGSPRKEDKGNATLEHAYLKFCAEYVSFADDGPQYADIWDDSWTTEPQMYAPLVAELNKADDEESECESEWERTDQTTIKGKHLDASHLLFFQTIVGINMNDANLRLPDLMLLQKEETKKKRRHVAASIKERSYGIGFELKRPIRRLKAQNAKSPNASASGAKKKSGKKRRNGDKDSPRPQKRRRLEPSRSEMSEDDDGDTVFEDAGQDRDNNNERKETSNSSKKKQADVKQDKLFGYFHAVSVAAKPEMIHSYLEKLRDVGLSRSEDNGVHSTEAWRRTIHQVATLACMAPSHPAFVVLSDLDPEFCSYLFWLSSLKRDHKESVVVCMARVRYKNLPAVVRKLEYTDCGDMLPRAWPPKALNDFNPAPFIPAETLVPKCMCRNRLQQVLFGLVLLCLSQL